MTTLGLDRLFARIMDIFVENLLTLSERAAIISRRCREEEELFQLLVEEKKGEENTKLVGKDFKTLADVLVQETIRSHLGEKFPSLKPYIYGEESNEFTNTKGQQVTVRVCETLQSTTNLLSIALDGNSKAAHLLASAVHESVDIPPRPTEIDQLRNIEFDAAKFGVWIDPIDCTSQYISGSDGVTDEGIYLHGLPCVTVLIGVYELSTGRPVVGVINQPFWKCDSSGHWTGRQVWGVTMNELNIVSQYSLLPESTSTSAKLVCVLSSSTDPEIVTGLQSAGFKVVFVSGAGYKQLCVIDGLASVYICTSSGTYKWDTCGSHAILSAIGGGMVYWEKFKNKVKESVTYHCQDINGLSGPQQWQNHGGVLAFRDNVSCTQFARIFTQ